MLSHKTIVDALQAEGGREALERTLEAGYHATVAALKHEVAATCQDEVMRIVRLQRAGEHAEATERLELVRVLAERMNTL